MCNDTIDNVVLDVEMVAGGRLDPGGRPPQPRHCRQACQKEQPRS